MNYLYVAAKEDYSRYASGHIFYSKPGLPTFPVRLASELFQRAWHHWHTADIAPRCLLYDPCCGGASHLAILGHLHHDRIGQIIGSDIETAVLPLAQRNLSLLNAAGLAQRRQEIATLHQTYRKPSHQAVLTHVEQIQPTDIQTRLFTADATQSQAVGQGLAGQRPNIVFADVPYGSLSTWQGENRGKTAVYQLLTALRPHLTPRSIVIIASNKTQKAIHPHYQRLERLRVGKRQIFLLKPNCDLTTY